MPALVLTLPILANFFARNTAEYFFDLLILASFYWAARGKYGLSWKNLIITSRYSLLWPLFLGVIVVGYLLNGGIGILQLRDLVLFLWILGLYCYARLVSVASFSEKAFDAFCVFLVILSVWLITDFFRHPPTVASTWGLPNRLQGTFTNTNFLAQSYYLIHIYLTAFLFIFWGKGKRWFLILSAFLGLSTVLFLTFNRSIWISSAIMIPLIAYMWRKRAGLITFGAFIVIFAMLYAFDFGNFSYRIGSTLNPAQSGDITRINLWKANFHIFLDNPVFGVGYYNNTREIVNFYKQYNITGETLDSHAHNEILSFLAGTGILGAILYLSFFVYFAYLGYQTLKRTPEKQLFTRGLLIGAIAIQPGFLLMGLADNNFEIHVARHFLVVTWAIILGIWYKTNSSLNNA